MKYSQLASYLEQFEEESSRLKLVRLTRELLKETSSKDINAVTLLLTGWIKPIQVGESLIKRAISEATGVNISEINDTYAKTGDLGLTAEKLWEKKSVRTLSSRDLTVGEIMRKFDKVRQTKGEGSQDAKVSILISMLTQASPRDAKYLIRAIQGELRTGVGEGTILQALSELYFIDRKSLDYAYRLSGEDIGHISTMIKAGKNVKDIGMRVGNPVGMMLAERVSEVSEIFDKLGSPVAVEWKFDGLRCQIHKDGQKVTLYSRNLKSDMTEQFPDVVEAVRNRPIKKFVTEGEIVAVDNVGNMLPFQKLTERRGRKYDIKEYIEKIPVKVFLFETLYYQGASVLTQPLSQRFMYLQNIADGDRLVIAPHYIVKNEEELDKVFKEAIEAGTEGIVAKNIHDPYKPGTRGWSWIKWKRSYKSEMADTVDLTVVGAMFGAGRRAGSYGALVLASYNPKTGKYELIGRTGTGFSDEQLDKLPKEFRGLVYARGSEKPHPKVVGNPGDADVWFKPVKVVEILGDEITISQQWSSGYSIRFPRFQNFRWDKLPTQTTTIQEIEKMYKSQLKKVC